MDKARNIHFFAKPVVTLLYESVEENDMQYGWNMLDCRTRKNETKSTMHRRL